MLPLRVLKMAELYAELEEVSIYPPSLDMAAKGWLKWDDINNIPR